MTHDELTTWARRLLDDIDRLRPWSSFVPHDGLAPEDAYALQDEVARLREARGERVVGYKVGCTSPAIQEQLGIHEPIFARVFETGCFPTAAGIVHSRFASLAIEGELAIRLARDLPPKPLSDEAYLRAIASVFPVIELHHHVLPADGHPLAALIASGGIHAGLVLADRETACPGQVPVVTNLRVAIDDTVAGTTGEPWTMGGPAQTLRWLSARLAGRGLSLRAGQVILTGSALPLFPVKPGQRVTAEALPLGQSIATIQ